MSEEEFKLQKKLTSFALRMAGDIGATIAIPVSVLTWLGRRGDIRLGHSKPYLVILAILVSFVISTVIVSKKAVNYGNQYVKLTATDDEKREMKRKESDKKSS